MFTGTQDVRLASNINNVIISIIRVAQLGLLVFAWRRRKRRRIQATLANGHKLSDAIGGTCTFHLMNDLAITMMKRVR